jgi:hypothetical protein
MKWQPAEGGEAVSASEAGWGEVETVAPAAEAAPAEAPAAGADGEAEVKPDENIVTPAADAEAPPVDADGETAEAPAAATAAVADGGEEGDG